MKPSLVVLAAGMGSRYGSLKQLDDVGPKGETIIDYTVYDAIQAGFGKVVFVIQAHFAAAFREKITSKFSDQIEVAFAFQQIDPPRTKPWGTGHAILVARDEVTSPFAVVNADDFYGYESLLKMATFLQTKVGDEHFAMVGFELEKTLSPHGTVSRGICKVDAASMLETVTERTSIQRVENQIIYEEKGQHFPLSAQALASMNLWGFPASFFKPLGMYFNVFINKNSENMRSEFYIPLVVNDLVEKGKIKVEVLPSAAQWYGVTYLEDKPLLEKALQALTAQGKYPSPLWK